MMSHIYPFKIIQIILFLLLFACSSDPNLKITRALNNVVYGKVRVFDNDGFEISHNCTVNLHKASIKNQKIIKSQYPEANFIKSPYAYGLRPFNAIGKENIFAINARQHKIFILSDISCTTIRKNILLAPIKYAAGLNIPITIKPEIGKTYFGDLTLILNINDIEAAGSLFKEFKVKNNIVKTTEDLVGLVPKLANLPSRHFDIIIPDQNNGSNKEPKSTNNQKSVDDFLAEF